MLVFRKFWVIEESFIQEKCNVLFEKRTVDLGIASGAFISPKCFLISNKISLKISKISSIFDIFDFLRSILNHFPIEVCKYAPKRAPRPVPINKCTVII